VTRIILIRHGETEWNARGLYQGQLNSPLTAAGRQQAIALAERLRGTSIDALYSSDLGRTQETAAPLVAASSLELRIDSRLRERHYGIFQSLDKTAVATLHPEAYAGYHSGDPDFQIPEGESTRQFHERITSCLEDLAGRHDNEQIAIVTHGGTIGIAIKYVLGLSLEAERRFIMANTSYNLIARDKRGWMLHTLGDISHLQDESQDDIT
jgi:probable phosphoglycerate mutase